ncbi:MAG: 6-phosphogluconolactonase [Desulfobacterales bacterium]|nr:6-phosphogluconolactonase [Desulfobacterales bacterium]
MNTNRKIIIVENAAALAQKGAEIFCSIARQRVEKTGRFMAALSGGSTPRPLYRLLGQPPYLAKVPWEATHLFWADERMVPWEDPDSNFGAAREDFIEKVPIPAGQVHPMPLDPAGAQGAALYSRTLRDIFRPPGNRAPAFDLLLLGVGADGHVASLFPDPADTLEGPGERPDNFVAAPGSRPEPWVSGVCGGSPHTYRLTLTLPVLNRAREILFVVSGKSKAPVLERTLNHPDARLPARQVDPPDGQVTWLVDKDAASALSPIAAT